MIVSHRNKFVFIKTRKTASTSVEVFLHKNLTENDIWTPLSNPKVLGNNYYSAWPFDFSAAKSKFIRRKLGERNPLYFRYFHDHASLKDLYKGYGEKKFSTYFKFCFDRNPWDYAVSLYHHKTKKKNLKCGFDEFVHTFPIPVNWEKYTIEDKIVVDAVFRYEDLEPSISSLVKKLNLIEWALPMHKTGWRPKKDYRDYYTTSTKYIISSRFSRVIDYLGYEF